ncbi:unnamed protein product [Wickerhamomyces anomalus]
MPSSDISHRVIELDPSLSSSFTIQIGRAARTPNQLSGTDKVHKLSRVADKGNLYFNERTISKSHASVKIEFSKAGVPSIVLEDQGSQHGVVWGNKRIPTNTKIRIKENDYVGLVDILNKNQFHSDSCFTADPDTVYFTPDSSWKDASVKSCKILLKFKTNIISHKSGTTTTTLDVEQMDPKAFEALRIDESTDYASNVKLPSDGSLECSESEEVVELDAVPELDSLVCEATVENHKLIDDYNEDDEDVDLFDVDTKQDTELISGSEEDHDENEDDCVNDLGVINQGKRKLNDTSFLLSEPGFESDSNSGFDDEDIDEILLQPIRKKQKSTPVTSDYTSSVRSHVAAGFTGLAVGAVMTFATLAALGERFAEGI